MFIEISGFADTTSGIRMPAHLRYQNSTEHDADNTTFLVLVRWLVPHPRAITRDSKHRPVCPPPFDINHALWTFARAGRRNAWRGRAIARQLAMFPGETDAVRRESASKLSHAFYDLVHVDSIAEIMNCTCVDYDSDSIMQTITIPF
jgi:hypothetical protein